MDDPRTLTELRDALRNGALTARALMQRVLAEMDLQPDCVWISRHPDATLIAAADACDAVSRERGPSAWDTQPLLGLPFAVKDNIDVAGLPTTAACPGYATGPVGTHAFAVERLVAAGAIPVGKTNLDQFATGLVGTRSPYGAVPNTFDASYVSGGSSSGSAHAVSTGVVPFALGTDTAGSGRVPAGFNNIAGLKPTRGWLSSRGMVPACRSLDCISVFALCPEDAWTVASLAAGHDAEDAYSRRAQPPRLRVDSLKGLRIGLPDPLEFFGDAMAQRAFAQALDVLVQSGCTIVPVPFAPLARAASLLYDGPWVAERYAAAGAWLEAHPEHADPTVAAIVASGKAPTAHALFSAQYEMEALRRVGEGVWAACDVMVTPTSPNFPTQAALAADPIGPNKQLGHYTNFVNLLDMAAHALPGPFRGDGLPAGITLIGPAFSDLALARLATRLVRLLQPSAGRLRHPLPPAPVLAAPVPATPMRIVAVGAHMAGLPLHWQFEERAARLRSRTTTAPCYRLYSLTGNRPTRPGLVHVGTDGKAIEVEVWEMDAAHVGSLLALIGPPLALGTVELADGTAERGFVCEPRAIDAGGGALDTDAGGGALDITHFGGWRGFLASLATETSP